MIGKTWHAGGKGTIPAAAFACLLGAAIATGQVSTASAYASSDAVSLWDPHIVREILMVGAAVVLLLAAKHTTACARIRFMPPACQFLSAINHPRIWRAVSGFAGLDRVNAYPCGSQMRAKLRQLP